MLFVDPGCCFVPGPDAWNIFSTGFYVDHARTLQRSSDGFPELAASFNALINLDLRDTVTL